MIKKEHRVLGIAALALIVALIGAAYFMIFQEQDYWNPCAGQLEDACGRATGYPNSNIWTYGRCIEYSCRTEPTGGDNSGLRRDKINFAGTTTFLGWKLDKDECSLTTPSGEKINNDYPERSGSDGTATYEDSFLKIWTYYARPYCRELNFQIKPDAVKFEWEDKPLIEQKLNAAKLKITNNIGELQNVDLRIWTSQDIPNEGTSVIDKSVTQTTISKGISYYSIDLPKSAAGTLTVKTTIVVTTYDLTTCDAADNEKFGGCHEIRGLRAGAIGEKKYDVIESAPTSPPEKPAMRDIVTKLTGFFQNLIDWIKSQLGLAIVNAGEVAYKGDVVKNTFNLKNTNTIAIPDIDYTDGSASYAFMAWAVIDSFGNIKSQSDPIEITEAISSGSTISLPIVYTVPDLAVGKYSIVAVLSNFPQQWGRASNTWNELDAEIVDKQAISFDVKTKTGPTIPPKEIIFRSFSQLFKDFINWLKSLFGWG